MAKFGSYNLRDKKYWEDKLTEIKIDKGKLFLVYENDKLRGYFSLVPKNADAGLVTEMLFSSKTAYNAIMGIIKSHSTQFKKVRILTPQYSDFFLLGENNNKFSHLKKPFIMGRVINARKVLDNILKGKNLSKKSFQIEVVDNQIEANNFVYNSKKDGLETKYIKMDISALAQLYTEFADIRELYITQKIETTDITFFEKLFGLGKKDNFINEYF